MGSLFFVTGDGGDMFPWNVGIFSAYYPRRQDSSESILVTKGTKSKCQTDVEKKLEEIGARFEQCSWRTLKIPIRETAVSEMSGVLAGRLSELEPFGTAVVHESPGMYVKQYVAFPASAVV